MSALPSVRSPLHSWLKRYHRDEYASKENRLARRRASEHSSQAEESMQLLRKTFPAAVDARGRNLVKLAEKEAL